MEFQLPLSVRWHGRGGQGVVTASRILATAALKAGHYMQSLPDFGAERSGAPVAAHTRIDTAPPAERGPIEAPDVVVILDASLAGQVDVTAGLKSHSAVIVNVREDNIGKLGQLPLKPGQALWTVDGSGIGTRLLGRNLPNTPVLGALARVVPVLPLDTIAVAMRELMSETFSEKVINANLQALHEGYEAVRRAEEVANA
jgi:pyruvate ferredoxin oxidoreductase gamma subunit